MDDIMLIEKVSRRDCIYNTESPHFRNQEKRLEAWKEIGKEMNCRVASVRKAWSLLRNTYSHAIKRRASSAHKIKHKWKYEKEMAFLLPYVETRQSQSDLESEKDELSITYDDIFEESTIVKTETSQHFKILDTQLVTTPVGYSDNQAKANENDLNANSAMENERTIQQNAAYLNETQAKGDAGNISISPLDDVDMFYLSMAKTVKRLPPVEQALVRMEICRVVSQAEIRYLQKGTCITTPRENPDCAFGS